MPRRRSGPRSFSAAADPRAQRVKLLEDEARVLVLEAQTLERESDRLLSQARTAEQRGRLDGG